VPAINAKEPNEETGRAGERSLAIENVRAVGKASGEATITISGRDGCRFENCCVHQGGRGRNGIRLTDSSGHVLTDSVVDVTGDPLVLENATAERRRFETVAALSKCL
jgi:hypothetical protein